LTIGVVDRILGAGRSLTFILRRCLRWGRWARRSSLLFFRLVFMISGAKVGVRVVVQVDDDLGPMF